MYVSSLSRYVRVSQHAAAKTSLIVEALRTQPTPTLIRCLVITDRPVDVNRLVGVTIDPETSLLGLAALRHHARTQTAAKHGSAVSRSLVSLFPCMCLGFFFCFFWVGFLRCLDDAVCVVGGCEFSLWCGAKKHHAVLFLSCGVTDLPMAPRTKPHFML